MNEEERDEIGASRNADFIEQLELEGLRRIFKDRQITILVIALLSPVAVAR